MSQKTEIDELRDQLTETVQLIEKQGKTVATALECFQSLVNLTSLVDQRLTALEDRLSSLERNLEGLFHVEQ